MDIKKIVDNIKEYDYSQINVDDFLDNRDIEQFETEWLKIYKQIDKVKIPEELRNMSDNLRKDVFLSIDEKIGVSELSEYISDDIELLIFADYLGIDSEWFRRFIDMYENGELPTGELWCTKLKWLFWSFGLEREKWDEQNKL